MSCEHPSSSARLRIAACRLPSMRKGNSRRTPAFVPKQRRRVRVFARVNAHKPDRTKFTRAHGEAMKKCKSLIFDKLSPHFI
jgi:hypothetical protein